MGRKNEALCLNEFGGLCILKMPFGGRLLKASLVNLLAGAFQMTTRSLAPGGKKISPKTYIFLKTTLASSLEMAEASNFRKTRPFV